MEWLHEILQNLYMTVHEQDLFVHGYSCPSKQVMNLKPSSFKYDSTSGPQNYADMPVPEQICLAVQ